MTWVSIADVRLYPQLPGSLAATVARDVLVAALLIGCLVVGQTVYSAVRAVEVVGEGVEQAGTDVRDGFQNAGRKLDDAPVVGDRLRDALDDAGRATGGRAISAGREGRREIRRLATILGWTVGGLPALLVLALWLPGRVRQARALSAAQRVLRGTGDPARDRLLAERAAYGLPYGALVRHTKDPLGDLAAGRLEPLHAAIFEHAGLRRPRRA